jgi:hypothetical protein
VTAVDPAPPVTDRAVHVIVDEPGLYDGMSDVAYHSDPVPGGSLSSSGARRLLAPSCPALFKHERDNGRASSKAFDFGHAAHAKVLGYGPELVVVDAADCRTKAAKEARDAAYGRAAVPLLAKEMAEVDAMAVTLRDHPVAATLLDQSRGMPEQSGFWVDAETGVWRRARYDWLPDTTRGRLIIPDYKTAACSSPAAFVRAAGSFGYHQQASWYMDSALALGLAEDVAFVFIVQEKTAPYLVSVVELGAASIAAGAAANRRALETYATCTADDYWPGYVEGVALVDLPPWALNAEEAYR